MGWDLGCCCWCPQMCPPGSPGHHPCPCSSPATSSGSLSKQGMVLLPNSVPGAAGAAGWQRLLPCPTALPVLHTRTQPQGHGPVLPLSGGPLCNSHPAPKQRSALLFIRDTGVIKLCPAAPWNSSLIIVVIVCSYWDWLLMFLPWMSEKKHTTNLCIHTGMAQHKLPLWIKAFPGTVPFILGLFPLFVLLFSEINFPYFCFSSVHHLRKGRIFSAFSLFSYANPYKKIISKCWHNSLPHPSEADEGRKAKSFQKWPLLANIQLIDFLLFC